MNTETIKITFGKVYREYGSFESDSGIVKVIKVQIEFSDEDGSERMDIGELRNPSIWIETGPGYYDGADRFGGYRFHLNESELRDGIGCKLYEQLADNCDLTIWDDQGDTAREARVTCEREIRELMDRARKLYESNPDDDVEPESETCQKCGGYVVACEA